MTRRSNGEGTYCKRADGRHVYKIRWDGERHEFYGKTKTEARSKMREALKRLEAGMPATDARTTLGAWLREWQDNGLKSRGLKPTTESTYRALIRCHIIGDAKRSIEPDPIARVAFDKLKPSHLTAWLVRLEGKGLGDASRRQLYHVMRLALDAAVDDELIGRNPAERVRRPVVEHKEARHLSPADVARVLQAAQGLRYNAALTLIAYTGMRRGEALALKWEAVDLVEGTLEVRGTLARIDGELVATPPKTKKSRRTLALHPRLVDLLAQHKDVQEAEKKALEGVTIQAGGKEISMWTDSGFVFTTEFGRPVDPRDFFRTMQTAAKRAKVAGVGVHTLRHSMASAAMANGANIKDVSEILGHSSVGITGDVYTHVTADSKRATLSQVADIFQMGGRKGGNSPGNEQEAHSA
ncbi:MAG: site-specific integrase [Coriobacteriia bacterium]|nr:site-specific integrase [Coriobacteriia bacterium]